MKSFLLFLGFAFFLAGCQMRFNEGPDSPFAQYVGRQAEVRKTVAIYDRGIFGRIGVPAGEWPISGKEEAIMTLQPGASFAVIGVSSRRIESGKHYYFACRYHTAKEEVMFDYPADKKFTDADYILWR